MPVWDCMSCRNPGAPACIVPLNLHHPLPCWFWSAFFLLPLGVYPSAIAQSSVGSFLGTWPIQFRLLRLTSNDVSALVISRTALLGICLFRLVLRTLPRHLVWKVSILFYSVLVSFQVSHLYISNTDTTKHLKREIHVLLFLHISATFEMLSSLLNDAPTIAILFLKPVVISPTWLTLAWRYVEL